MSNPSLDLPFCRWLEKFFSFVIRLDYIQAYVISYFKVNCTIQDCAIMGMIYHHHSHILGIKTGRLWKTI